VATVAFSLLALVPFRRGGQPDAVEMSFVVLSATLASPIAWEHHYGILLPIYALLFAPVWRRRHEHPLALGLFAASYVLASNYFGIARRFAEAGGAWTLLQSYLFAAALIVWGLLLKSPVGNRVLDPTRTRPLPEAGRAG
jgi:hypothetical protein